jgi:hypothetical protein
MKRAFVTEGGSGMNVPPGNGEKKLLYTRSLQE